MKSTGRPLVLAVAGGALALVSGAAALSASLGAASAAGAFPVTAHDGMAPGSVPALVCLLGLALVGVGAAVHDGRALRRPARGVPAVASGATSPASAATGTGRADRDGSAAPVRRVHVITSLAPQPAAAGHGSTQAGAPRAAASRSAADPRAAAPRSTAQAGRRTPGTRRTSAGTRLDLVGAGRRS